MGVLVLVAALDDPERLAELAMDAERDGHRMVSRLIAEWTEGTNRFDRPRERLYVATVDGRVVGVCGLNVDPYVADERIGRVRRLYVSAGERRLGIGSVLVERILQDARGAFDVLRLRTRNPVAAAFYESHGFIEVEGDEACTHQLVSGG
jgi:GNAT superfamily N-acetyltransferase